MGNSSKTKVRFIEPHGRLGRPFNAWITRWPLLGPVTLATILQRDGYDVQVYNENISGPLDENPVAYADVLESDVVGIGIMTSTASRGYRLAERIKKDSPSTRTVVGGTHATFVPHEAARYADIVVCGEGETVIGSIVHGEVSEGIVRAEPLMDMDSLPTPEFTLMRDFHLLQKGRSKKLYELPVMASRGCPYGCTYCSVTRMFGRKVRRRSVEKVHQDIRRYCEQGFERFFFYDDNFTADRAWTQRLLDRLRPMDVQFNAQVRVDFAWKDRHRGELDKQLLKSMEHSGGDVMYIGYETIDQKTAKQWHKGYSGSGDLRQNLLEDSRILHDHGFWIHGMFVLGPQHGERTAGQIVDFARQSDLETLQISILTPLPGTPLYQQMRDDLIFTDYPTDWDFYDGTHCVYRNSRLGLEAMQKLVLDAHKKFYRWGGWSMRRMRALLEQKIPAMTKIRSLWQHARIARTTMKEWHKETKLFLEMARSKCAI